MWRCQRCGLELPINPKGSVLCKCGFREIKEPSNIQKLINFSESLIGHVFTGMKRCTQEQINERMSICEKCELFIRSESDKTRGVCGHSSCGCNLRREDVFLNKLAWAEQKCPLEKWNVIL